MKSNILKDKTILLYFIGKFLIGLRFFVPIWIIFGKQFLDLSGLGLLEAITYLITIFIDTPSGALADQIGRKKVIIIGLSLLGIGHVLTGFSTEIWHYAMFGIIANIGASFVSGADSALIYDHLLEQKSQHLFVKIQSYAAFSFRIGIIIATFLGGMLYNQAVFLPFVLMGIMELLSIICWIFIKEPRIDTEKFTFKGYFQQIKTGVNQVVTSNYLISLTTYYVLIGSITFVCFYFFNYSYALDLGLGVDQQSLLFGVTGITKAIAVFLIGYFYAKFTRKRVFIGFTVAMVVFYLPAAFVGKVLAIIIITVIDTLGAIRIALLDKFINDEISAKNRATTLSFIEMLINIVYLLLVWQGTRLADTNGTNTLYTIFGIISLLIILPLAIYLVRRNPQELSVSH